MSESKLETVDTLIIGGGQAGLAMSYHLTQRGQPHLVLERGRVGERWISERWLGMHFQTPNAMVTLPGYRLPAADKKTLTALAPPPRSLPILRNMPSASPCGTAQRFTVTALRRTNEGFAAETSEGVFQAKNVVVTTGPFQTPSYPQDPARNAGRRADACQFLPCARRPPARRRPGSRRRRLRGTNTRTNCCAPGARCISPSAATSGHRGAIVATTMFGGGSKPALSTPGIPEAGGRNSAGAFRRLWRQNH